MIRCSDCLAVLEPTADGRIGFDGSVAGSAAAHRSGNAAAIVPAGTAWIAAAFRQWLEGQSLLHPDARLPHEIRSVRDGPPDRPGPGAALAPGRDWRRGRRLVTRRSAPRRAARLCHSERDRLGWTSPSAERKA